MINVVISYKNKRSPQSRVEPRASQRSRAVPTVLRVHGLTLGALHGLEPTTQQLEWPRLGLVLGACSRPETRLGLLVLVTDICAVRPRESVVVGVPCAGLAARAHRGQISFLKEQVLLFLCCFCYFNLYSTLPRVISWLQYLRITYPDQAVRHWALKVPCPARCSLWDTEETTWLMGTCLTQFREKLS